MLGNINEAKGNHRRFSGAPQQNFKMEPLILRPEDLSVQTEN